ncbi:transcriptional regulator [Mycobacterium sp. MS1601]|uniref:MarR family winged helix-turn-helix transcriptional regulator n=1 Tax=Mycobacterium sp. MS1601 TaxID=1936029 RepID=UPI00097931E9|nr:MarR family transcriptional regulator [Mycobacterium sp. MS1601]AQA06537.1 transcriptional regulator [Mycobacterium sp. MS1601]
MKTKSETVHEIGRLIDAVSDKFDTDVDAEREFMRQGLPDRLRPLADAVPRLGVHLLDAIEAGSRDGDPLNVVVLAARSGQLKGTVSKHVQKLIDHGLVRRDPVPGNRKEIRLSATSDGRRVVEVHRQMHDEIDAGLRDFLMRYSAGELATVNRMLRDLLAAQRRGVRLVPPTEAQRTS